MTTIHIAVIEWDSSVDPEVITGIDEAEVQLRTAKSLWDGAQTDPDHDDLPSFIAEYGDPTAEGVDVGDWLAGHRDATTVPWATFYQREVYLGGRTTAPTSPAG